MKVKSTNEYQKRNLKAQELGRIPKEGEVFEIKNEKFSMLNGNNKYKAVFVEKVNENNEDGQTENNNEVDNILNQDKETKNENEEENEVDKILNDNKELSNNKNSKGKNK